MRHVAAVPGCEGWIEFTDVWSRVDLRRTFQLDGQEFLDFLAAKALACYLEAIEGEPITVPADLSVMANIERLDLRMVEFLSQALVSATGDALKGARSGFFCVPSSPVSDSQDQPPTQT